MAKETDSKTINVRKLEGETEQKAMARSLLSPDMGNALTIHSFTQTFGDTDLKELIEGLNDQSQAVHGGDLKRAESILINQAHTLDALFNSLARRAAANMGEYLQAAETYLKLALRAQNQSRATLQTLGELKNPQPVAFVKQANISNGPQQVNNGSSHPRTQENQIQQNELLEVLPSERLDTRAQSATSRINSPLEAVGALNGA